MDIKEARQRVDTITRKILVAKFELAQRKADIAALMVSRDDAENALYAAMGLGAQEPEPFVPPCPSLNPVPKKKPEREIPEELLAALKHAIVHTAPGHYTSVHTLMFGEDK